jgi:hypothetical protein
MITVACVLRSGGDYTAEDVERLRDGVAGNLTLPHRFVCLSDVPVPCERIPLTSGWPGWWSKMELFRPDIAGGLLFFDLDTVIAGNLDAIAAINRFAILRDVYRGGRAFQSSAMFLPEATRREVWRKWVRDPLGHMRDCGRGGDQVFLESCELTRTFWQDELPGHFVSYKVHVRAEHRHPRETGSGSIPDNARVVIFHGYPRPREVNWLTPLLRN